MRLATRFTAWTGLTLTLCWVAVLALTGATGALLFLAPALLIAIPLLSGRYVGEELIARLAARRSRPPARAGAPRPAAVPRSPRVWPARGTSLIAFSLAKRPPPALLLTRN